MQIYLKIEKLNIEAKKRQKIKSFHLNTSRFVGVLDFVIYPRLKTDDMLKKSARALPKSQKRLLQALSPAALHDRVMFTSRKYGKQVLSGTEYYTTQKCSNCPKVNNIGRSRTYTCDFCHLKMPRDENSALNILAQNANQVIIF